MWNKSIKKKNWPERSRTRLVTIMFSEADSIKKLFFFIPYPGIIFKHLKAFRNYPKFFILGIEKELKCVW